MKSMKTKGIALLVAPAFLIAGWSISWAQPVSATKYEEGPQPVPMAQPARADADADLVDRNRNGLSDGLEARLGALGGSDVVDVVVTFSGAGNATSAARTVGAFDVIQEFTIIDGFAATMTVGQARALARTPGVFRVEEVFELSANLQTARNDFGVDAVQLGLSGTPSLEGSGIGICIVDSGARATHIAFNDDESGLRIKGFYNALTNGPSQPGGAAFDDYGHGTLVAGIAAGDNRGTPHPAGWDDPLRGVAPRADLYIAKALSSTGTGSSVDVIEAIEWCQDQPVRVINLSLGFASSSDGLDSLSQAVNNAVIGGMVVVVAAGNSGANPYTIGSPAAAERAITVGAVADWSSGNFTHTPKGGIYPVAFSSRGPTADDRTKPDIMAPGVDIAAPYFEDDTNYAIASGTSMSAPFVTGAVALMLEADSGLLTHEVREILYNTAQDRGDATNGAEKDNDYGFGLIDVQAAVGTVLGLPLISVQTEFPTYYTDTNEIVNSVDFSVDITSDTDINIWGEGAPPLSITLLIEGAVECALSRGPKCFGYEWRPDLDAELLDSGGVADLSTCMLDSDTECGAADSGRQETLIEKTPAVGLSDYTLNVFMGTNDRTEGQFRYEISTGPLVVGILIDPPVTIASDNPNPNNNAPVADDQAVATNEDTSVPITLTASDADGDPLTYVVVSGPSNGSLSGTAPDLTYMPNLNFNGPDSFTFKANDGFEDGNIATVSVTVAPVNDAPELVSNISDQNAVVGAEFTLDVSANFTDVDGDTLTYSITTPNWLTISSGGVLSGTPGSTSDTRSVTVTASDGTLTADSNTFTITVSETSIATSVVSLADGGSMSQGKTWTANVAVTLEDNGDPVSGAQITGDWSTGNSGTCTTDLNGNCTVSKSGIAKRVGSVTFNVTNVTDPNWDGVKPSITVFKP